MTDTSRDELASALLDGQLTAEERREAEQRLADDPAFRQIYEELRLVRAAVAGLPRHKFDRDISRRVLRRAERQMLLGSEAPSGEESTSLAEPLSVAEATWRRDWRTVLWPALVVAAALLLLVFSPRIWSPPAHQEGAPNAVIAEKAPAIGQHSDKSKSAPSAASSSTAPPPSSVAENPAGNPTQTERVASTVAPSSPKETATLVQPPAYLVAEVAPETIRQSDFHELLKSQEIRLESDGVPRRATSRLNGPLASPSARAAIEEANRAKQQAETAYLITATREQVERTIAALSEQSDKYSIVEQTALPDETTVNSRDSEANARLAVARRFAARADAEAAAKQASGETAAAQGLVTVIIVLRTSADESC